MAKIVIVAFNKGGENKGKQVMVMVDSGRLGSILFTGRREDVLIDESLIEEGEEGVGVGVGR
jgi:hypothetical protein